MRRAVWKRLLAIAVFLIVLGASFFLFSLQVDRLTTQNVRERLSEVAESNADLVRIMFERDILVLENLAQYWSNDIDPASAASLTYLHDVGARTNYLRLALDLPSGTSYTSDGRRIDVSGRSYLKDVLAGQNVVSNLVNSTIDRTEVFSIAVPVYRDGKVIAALRGVYTTEVLNSIVDQHTFGGTGSISLINAKGDFLVRPRRTQHSYADNSIFTVLENAQFSDQYTIDQLRDDLAQRRSGYTAYTLSQEELCAYYTPVDISNWYVLSVVPTAYLLQQKLSIDSIAILLLAVVLGLFTALAVLIVLQNRHARRLLQKDKEYLERVLNSIPLPVFISHADRRLSFINEAACTLFACASDLVGQPCQNFNTSICNTPNCAIEKMERTGCSTTYYSDAENNSYKVSTAILLGQTPKDKEYIEVVQDISDVVKIQRILEEKTLELETLSENLSVGLLITSFDEGFPVIRCNMGYALLIDRMENEILGHRALKWVAPEDAAMTEKVILQQLAATGEASYDHRLVRQDGKRIWVNLHGKRTMLHGGAVGIWIMTDISDIHEAQMNLKINEERYRVAMQNTDDILIDYDLRSKTMYHSSKAMEIYNVPELLYNVPETFLQEGPVLPESHQQFLELFDQIRAGVEKCSCTIKARATDGNVHWNRLTFSTIFDGEHNPVRAIGILQDITREKEVERQYRQETRYRELGGSDSAFYYEADLTQHRFISGHEGIVQAYYTEPTDDFDTIIGLLLDFMVYEPDRMTVQSHIEWEALMRSYEAGITWTTFEYRRCVAGMPAWVECAIHIFRDEETSTLRVIGCIKDINAAKMRELAFQQKAERDLLTGLYNKVTAEAMIREFTRNPTNDPPFAAFLLIDLDNFKRVNDTMGHAFGDSVLTRISRGLLDLSGEANIAGRLGGDEFVVFLREAQDKDSVTDMAQKICEMFHGAYEGKSRYKISGSIGIALFPQHGKNFEALYKNADRALYFAKERGKDVFFFYSHDLPERQENIQQ